jgi:hypothetical protein
VSDVQSHVAGESHKYRKSDVEFEHPAKGKDHCGQCTHFEVEAVRHCEIVAGIVESIDWCDKFERK